MKAQKFAIVLFVILGVIQHKIIGQADQNTLWYNQPAMKWTDAFPLGNGRLAAMDFGGASVARFQLNEESLWAGKPDNPYAEDYNYKFRAIQQLLLDGKTIEANAFGLENMVAAPTSFRSYEPLGDILIKFKRKDSVTNYRRTLDLSTGISKVSYTLGNTDMIRESFISAVDDVMCIRLVSHGDEKINCRISLDREKDVSIQAVSDGTLQMDGQIVDIEAPDAFDPNAGGSGEGGAHMRFSGTLKAEVSSGDLKMLNNSLIVENADEIVLLFTAATDYNLSQLNFDRAINPSGKVLDILQKAQNKTWEELKERHSAEHRSIFDRVRLHLAESPSDALPTDERLLAFKNGAKDPGLTVQLFQFGRYLLMGSSRAPGVLPANLQGKWSERMWAPWEADYHLNVNLQMNYWGADITNISETTDPLIHWFERIAEESKPLAKTMYGSNGWFSHHASNPFGRVTPSASTLNSQFNNGVLDALPGAWMLMNLWDHYEFTQDKVFLEERLYPLLRGASAFILDIFVLDLEGKLQYAPSTSPENLYLDVALGEMQRITVTSTYHLSIIKAVFKATQEAASILGFQDNSIKSIRKASDQLPQILTDTNGRIREWREDVQEKEAGHRHLSHLLGVHPFALITPETPELFEAAKKTLAWREHNGHGGMGWAHAHALLMHARLLEPEKAHHSLVTLLTKGQKSSLMNTIGPFQIDGNLGAVAGISEMLIQSHLKDDEGNFRVHLLPALPMAWSTGSVTGLKARGGFEVGMEWENGKLMSASITSQKGGSCTIKYQDALSEVKLEAGEKKKLTF